MSQLSQMELDARYDEAKAWVGKVAKERLQGSFSAALKNGVALCRAVNNIADGAIERINEYSSTFRQIENINFFLRAAQLFGVPTADLFAAEDLFEERNLPKVYLTLQVLASILVSHGVNVPALEDDEVDAVRALARETAIRNAGTPARAQESHLSVFEANQARSQKLASSAQPYRASNLIRTDQGAGAQNALSFADQSLMAAQKHASSAMTANNNIVKSGDRPIGGLSMAESTQLEAQKLAFGATGANNNIVRSEKGAGTGGLSFTDERLLEAQKIASGASGTNNNIVRSEKGAGTGGLNFTDERQLEAQRLASSANTSGHNIVRIDDESGAHAQPSWEQ